MTEPTPPQRPLRAPKQRGTAYLASLAGTLTPIVLVSMVGDSSEPQNLVLMAGVSAMLLPSAGHWYAGKFFTAGMGIRLVSGTVATLSLLVLAESDEVPENVEAAFWIGALGLGVGAIYDIATAGSAVDDWNRKNATAVAPAVMKIGTGYGVGLAGRF